MRHDYDPYNQNFFYADIYFVYVIFFINLTINTIKKNNSEYK